MTARAVVVTGAGAGLGRAYALDLAAHGARVMVNDVAADAARETVELVRRAGGVAECHAGSVESWTFAEALVESCCEAFGSVDGLVNNAGVLRVRHSWEEDEDGVRRIVGVNVLGALNCGLAALRTMRGHGGGVVVNISSGSAHGTRTGLSTYAGSKGALLSLTYGWAAESGATGVRVNAVMPVGTTAMSHQARPGGVADPRDPAAVAPLIRYLLGDESSQINGRVFRYDGETLSLLPRPDFGRKRPVTDPAGVGAVAAALLAAEADQEHETAEGPHPARSAARTT